MPTLTIRPTANSGPQLFVANGAASQWDCVDETPHDGYTTYLSYSVSAGGTGSGASRFTTSFVDPGIGVVNSVRIYAICGYDLLDPTGYSRLAIGCRRTGSTTDHLTADTQITAWSVLDSGTMTVRPWDSAAWTLADITGFRFVIKGSISAPDVGGGGGRVVATQIYADVDWSAGASETIVDDTAGGLTIAGQATTIEVADPSILLPTNRVRFIGQPTIVLIGEAEEHRMFLYDRRQKMGLGPIGGPG